MTHEQPRRRLDPVQLEKARNMRRTMTTHELELWQRLRRNQLGVHFRRQHPIGPFIVDFAAVSAKLVIEVDGATHEDLEREALRDRELSALGWRVMHFTNFDIEEALEVVVAMIREVTVQPVGPQKIDRSKGTASRPRRSTGTRSHPTPNPSQREG